MDALVCEKPGSFEYKTIAAPVMEPGHAILKIRRIGICGTDLHAFRGTQPYFNYPRILGHELAADLVEADDTSEFVPGEALTFVPYFSCGKCIACRNGKSNCCTSIKVSGVHIDGGMVTYFKVPVTSLLRSKGLSYDELALVEPLSIGAHAIRRAQITPGEYVLVTGAGPIGLATMEFARIAGAKVIALDVNDNRLSFCKQQLGIPYTINPATQNAVALLAEITSGDMPEVVMDATGNLKAINTAFEYMSHGGRYILVGLQRDNITFSHPEFHKREGTLMSSRNAIREDFEFVIDCIHTKLVDPKTYITHRVPFREVKDIFPSWLDPSSKLIKAIVEMD